MPVYKALPILLIVGLVVATGGFYFFEDMRPPAVERLFLQAAGYGPADTPGDAIEKFQKAMRARNYKAAASLCGGEYADNLRRVAKRATALGNAVEDLLHNVKDVAAINAPKAELAVEKLYPFPTDFKVLDIKPVKGEEDDHQVALLLLGDGKKVDFETAVRSVEEYRIDQRILFSVTPRLWNGAIELKREGDKKKSWKIYMPEMTSLLRESMDFLRDNGGNYIRALDNIKYAIKHEAATKADFESQLKNELGKAKADK